MSTNLRFRKFIALSIALVMTFTMAPYMGAVAFAAEDGETQPAAAAEEESSKAPEQKEETKATEAPKEEPPEPPAQEQKVAEEPAEETTEAPAKVDSDDGESEGVRSNQQDPNSGGQGTTTPDTTQQATTIEEETTTEETVAEEKEEKYEEGPFTWSDGTLSVKVTPSKKAFPEGTKMKAKRVSAQRILKAAEREGMENPVDAAAVDITFHKDGREIQPDGNVKVSIRTNKALEGDAFRAVTVDGSGNLEDLGKATGSSATVHTNHFTVYGIVGTEYEDEDVKQYIRHTYEFYAGNPDTDMSTWGKVADATVHDGDPLDVPADPTGYSKRYFDGWYVVKGGRYTNTQVVSQDRVTIDPATRQEAEEAGLPAEDKTIKVYAKYTARYKVTLYTTDKMKVAYETYLGEPGETIPGSGAFPKAEDEDFALPIEEGKRFAGWKLAGTADTALVDSVTIDADKPRDLDLVPVFEDAYTVNFEVNAHLIGQDPYRDVIDMDIPSQPVAVGEGAAEPKTLPIGYEENGYKFTGWYDYENIDELVYDQNTARFVFDETRKWDFTKPVERDMTLYAGWEPQEVQYRIVLMQENTGGASGSSGYTEWMEAPAENCKTTIGTEYKDLLAPAKDFVDAKRSASSGLANDSRESLHHFHPSRTGVMNDEGSCPYWIQVEQADGTCLAYMDAASGAAKAMVKRQGEDRIRGTSDIVVRIYENRNTYNLKVVYRTGCATTNTISAWTGSGGPVLKEEYKDVLPNAETIGGDAAYEKYGDLSDQVYTIRFRENLYRTIYQDEKAWKIRDLMESWYLVKFFGKNGGQTVFDRTNSSFNLIPEAKVKDGDTVLITVEHKPSYKHEFRSIYLYPDGTVNEAKTRSNFIAYGKPHSHKWSIGLKSGGYFLYSIFSGTITYTEASSQKGYYFEYDENGDPYPMILTNKPYPFTITFVPNDGKDSFQATNGAWDVEDKKAFYVDDSIAHVADEAGAAGEYAVGDRKVIGDLTREFKGWYDNKDCTGEPYDFTDQTMPPKDLTFYAKWEAKGMKFVYHPLNGDEETTRTCYIGEKPVPIRNPKKDKFVFSGWYLDENATAGNKFDFAPVLDEDRAKELDAFGGDQEDGVIHLYAKWNPFGPYTIVYHANGGTLSDELKAQLNKKDEDKTEYRGGSVASVKGVGIPAVESEIFAGWEIGKPDSGVIVQYGKIFDVDIDHDAADGNTDTVIHLYAKYVDKDRKTFVTFHTNYPEGESENGKTAEMSGLKVNARFTVPAIDGEEIGWNAKYRYNDKAYAFVCWTNEDGETIFSDSSDREYFQEAEETAAGIQDNHLYAVWEEVEGEFDIHHDPEKEPEESSEIPKKNRKAEVPEEEETMIPTNGETPSGSHEKETDPAPGTGDASQVVLWIILMAACVVGIAGVMIYRRRRSA